MLPTIWQSSKKVYESRVLERIIYQSFEARYTYIKNLNSVNQLIFVMVKCGVLFEVRTEFLNNI
jgi:hypothetical protein